MTVVNLFAYRATDPAALRGLAYRDAVGEHNDASISGAALGAGLAVAAWGAGVPEAMRARVGELLALPGLGGGLDCLGATRDGSPRHPLYVRGGTEPRPWARPAATAARP